jgi:hypothetical protein
MHLCRSASARSGRGEHRGSAFELRPCNRGSVSARNLSLFFSDLRDNRPKHPIPLRQQSNLPGAGSLRACLSVGAKSPRPASTTRHSRRGFARRPKLTPGRAKDRTHRGNPWGNIGPKRLAARGIVPASIRRFSRFSLGTRHCFPIRTYAKTFSPVARVPVLL